MINTEKLQSRWDAFFGRVPEEYVARYKEEKRRTNLSRMFGLSIFIIAVQVALNILNILKPGDSTPGDIMKFVYLSLFTLGTGIVFLVLSILVRRKVIKNTRAQVGMPYVLLYMYVAIQMTFFQFNIRAEGGVNCYICRGALSVSQGGIGRNKAG